MPNPTPNERIIEQLTRIADSLELMARELDHNPQHGFSNELIDQLRMIAQKHR